MKIMTKITIRPKRRRLMVKLRLLLLKMVILVASILSPNPAWLNKAPGYPLSCMNIL